MFRYEIEYSKIDEILYKIRYAIENLRDKYNIVDDVEIQMPNYFLELLKHQNIYLFNEGETSNGLKLFGCKTSNSPDHYIRVFHKDMPKLNYPAEVISINNENVSNEGFTNRVRNVWHKHLCGCELKLDNALFNKDRIEKINEFIDRFKPYFYLGESSIFMGFDDFKCLEGLVEYGEYRGVKVFVEENIPKGHMFIKRE